MINYCDVSAPYACRISTKYCRCSSSDQHLPDDDGRHGHTHSTATTACVRQSARTCRSHIHTRPVSAAAAATAAADGGDDDDAQKTLVQPGAGTVTRTRRRRLLDSIVRGRASRPASQPQTDGTGPQLDGIGRQRRYDVPPPLVLPAELAVGCNVHMMDHSS